MAIDFSSLPPQQELPEDAPSVLAWAVVFLLIVVVAVFVVLYCWSQQPQEQQVHSGFFWVCVGLFPPALATIIVTRPFSRYQGRCLRVQADNTVRARYVEQLFAHASQPSALLAAAYRFDLDDAQNALSTLAAGEAVLTPQAVPGHPGLIKARWLTPGAAALASTDLERQRQLLRWWFLHLLDELGPSLALLPHRVPLKVQLEIASQLPPSEIRALWDECWTSAGCRPAAPLAAPVQTGLMCIDAVLGEMGSDFHPDAQLIVSVQLNRRFEAIPVVASAEAAAALLLIAPDMAARYALTPQAYVHRPMQEGVADMQQAIDYALRWGQAQPTAIARCWMTGLGEGMTAKLHAALSTLDVSGERDPALKEVDMDFSVGHSGICAGWLALACAARTAYQTAAPQLVIEQAVGVLNCVVVKSDYLSAKKGGV